MASGQSQQFGIVGFVAGRKAEQMSSMHSSAIISKTLSQLDEIFGRLLNMSKRIRYEVWQAEDSWQISLSGKRS